MGRVRESILAVLLAAASLLIGSMPGSAQDLELSTGNLNEIVQWDGVEDDPVDFGSGGEFLIGGALALPLGERPGMRLIGWQNKDGYREDRSSPSIFSGYAASAEIGLFEIRSIQDLTDAPIAFHAGAGLGFSQEPASEGEPAPVSNRDNEEIALVWQLGAGVAWHFTPSFAVSAGYRYSNMVEPSLDLSGTSASKPLADTHSFVFGARFAF